MARIGIYKTDNEDLAPIALHFISGKLKKISYNTDKIGDFNENAWFFVFAAHIVSSIQSGVAPHKAKGPALIKFWVSRYPRKYYRFLKKCMKLGLMFPKRHNGKLYWTIPTLILED